MIFYTIQRKSISKHTLCATDIKWKDKFIKLLLIVITIYESTDFCVSVKIRRKRIDNYFK